MPADPPGSRDWRDQVESSFGHTRERRQKERSNCNVQAQLWLEDDARDRTALVRLAVVRNLSESGAFLETPPLPLGSRILIKIQNEDQERIGEVVWFEDPGPSARMRRIHGVGVRFLVAASATP